MRMILKILLCPISLLLGVFVSVSGFIIGKIAILLNILSGVLFFAALAAYAEYFIGIPWNRIGDTPTLQLAIFATIFGFVLSPYGLPALAFWLMGKLDNLKDAIKSI